MKTKRSVTLMSFLKEKHGMAAFSEIQKAGFEASLKAHQRSGEIEKAGRGLYRLSSGEGFSNPDLATVSIKAPHAVVCLISALSFHQATDQIPHEVHLAIPRGSWANKISHPPVHYYNFSKKAYEAGIEEHTIDGRKVRVYSLAKTIADCFKFRRKIGENIGLEALKAAVSEHHVSPNDIMRYAKICRAEKSIKPYLKALT